MDFTEKEFKMYQSINFHSRYEKLSNDFQFQNRPKYSNDAVIKSMTDSSGRWNGWSKMTNRLGAETHGIQIHYNALWENGVIKATDDFKFIDKQ